MSDKTPRLILTCGDPAGIGPDICLSIATDAWPAAVAVVGDPDVLMQRAAQLRLDVAIDVLAGDDAPAVHRAGRLQVVAQQAAVDVVAGTPAHQNSPMVLESLRIAATGCLDHHYDAMVTAPVSKAVLAAVEPEFRGHTEYLAALAGTPVPVMMLCAGTLRVALVTTHLPLSAVAAAITRQRLGSVLDVLLADLRRLFGLSDPHVLVCGLNPHAGESGKLGCEEIDIIAPVLDEYRQRGFRLTGPLPADTLFLPRNLEQCDAVLAMYHDQGLPVLKHAGFGEAVNVTLGLPFIRTSVDHGTAFDLAGSGRADADSLRCALRLAIELAGRSRRLQ